MKPKKIRITAKEYKAAKKICDAYDSQIYNERITKEIRAINRMRRKLKDFKDF